MAANLSIDPELIKRAPGVSGERTKKAAVRKRLEELIARRRQKRLLDLMGRWSGIRPMITRRGARAIENWDQSLDINQPNGSAKVLAQEQGRSIG